MLPTFITGNLNKVAYLNRTLQLDLPHHPLDLDEIQSTNPREVVQHKVLQAYAVLGQPVLVEDTSLFYTATPGLPGPFVKFFIETGLDTMCRLLDSFEDRSAVATATYGYHDGVTTRFFAGYLPGQIVKQPRGAGGYGWDSIFAPQGYNGLTRAELDEEGDLRTYSMMRDTTALREFLLNN